MGFRSSILAGVNLVRRAIQSPNFQSGVSGWAIRRDGTAEFSDMTVRSSDGSSSSIVLANGQIVIRNGSSVIVVEIDATGYRLYNTAGTLVAEITQFGGADSDPGFISYAPAGTRFYSMLSKGFLEFGIDGTSYDVQPFIEHDTTGGNDPLILAAGSGVKGDTGTASAVWRLVSETTGARPRMEIDSDFADHTDLTVTGNIEVGGTDIGTGIHGYANITSSTATTTSTTDTVAITLSSRTYNANRAYEVKLKAFVSSTVAADEVGMRVRKTDAAGAVLLDIEATGTIHRASQNYMVEVSNVVKVGASDVTAAIVATYFRRNGTGNARLVASAVNPAFIEIKDVGDAADYPNATTLS